MAQAKPATVYLDVHVHRMLKVRAARDGTTLSALLNEAARRLLAEAGEPVDSEHARRLKLDWAGALADLKDQHTSVELQHRAARLRQE
jgi:hypothetical protein